MQQNVETARPVSDTYISRGNSGLHQPRFCVAPGVYSQK
jgi:hypothetical protein